MPSPFLYIYSYISNDSVLYKYSFFYTQLNVKMVLFQTIQFSIEKQFHFKWFSLAWVQFSSIWPIDRTLSGATTLGHSGPGSDGIKWVLCIPQSSSITGVSPSDCSVLYPGHSFVGGLTPQQISSWCILQPRPTGRQDTHWVEGLAPLQISSQCILQPLSTGWQDTLGGGLSPMQISSRCILQPPHNQLDKDL